MTALLLPLVTGGQAKFDLRPRLVPGRTLAFEVREARTEGTTRAELGTRYALVARDRALSADLTTGPFFLRGRTFGRSKTSPLRLTAGALVAGDAFGRPPFPLSVPLPGKAVALGATWTGTVVGPTPVPAGVRATYRAVAPVTVRGVRCLKVTMRAAVATPTRIVGRGEFLIRLDDGFVHSGSAAFDLAYLRPDPKTRKMAVNSRVAAKASVVRR